MKFKKGDKVRFIKDCQLYITENVLGEIIPANSEWIVEYVSEKSYGIQSMDKKVYAIVPVSDVHNHCKLIKASKDKHNILADLVQTDGSVDGEKLMHKLEAHGMPQNDDYYEKSAMQPLEVSQVLLTREQFMGALLFNIIKYRMRMDYKHQKGKDEYKARQYAYWLELVQQGKTIDPSKDIVPDDFEFKVV